MDTTTIIGIITMIVTFILGLLSKKSKFGDWNTAIAGVGLFTGGVYDLGTNLNELFKKGE